MSSGGRREGAGRPIINPAKKRKRIDLYVAPETADRIRELRKRGININRHLDQWVDDLSEEFGI